MSLAEMPDLLQVEHVAQLLHTTPKGVRRRRDRQTLPVPPFQTRPELLWAKRDWERVLDGGRVPSRRTP